MKIEIAVNLQINADFISVKKSPGDKPVLEKGRQFGGNSRRVEDGWFLQIH
jgi:hypothetical protein